MNFKKQAVVVGMAAMLLAACSTFKSPAPSFSAAGLTDSLTSSLGLSTDQATQGTAALLSLAEEKLPASSWTQIMDSVGGLDGLMKAVKGLGLPSPIGDLSGLSGTLSQLGISSDQVTKMIPTVADYIGQAAGSDIGNQVLNALK
jgi:hypothetical protein